MKILVVGGAGYIGSHVCKSFIENGDEVTVFDNFSSGLKENLQAGAKCFEGDILQEKELHAVCSENKFEGIIHLAALKAAGESMEIPEIYAKNNISGAINLLNAAVAYNIPHFVFSSTAAVYGEPKYLPVDEKHPTNPENFYGYTKLATENMLNWYDKLKNISFASLRYFNAAGYAADSSITGLEKSPQNLLPVVMETACGIRKKMQVFGETYLTEDGTCIRDYVHVSDLAQAHVQALSYLQRTGTSFTVNLGSEQGASVMEIINMAESITGKTINYEITGKRPGDATKLLASSSLAKRLLGWEPKYSDINCLVQTTWKAYRHHFPDGDK